MPHLKVNRKLEPFLTKHKPIKIAIGGRGSGKSIGFGDTFILKMGTEGADIYCLREFQDSVTDSVHRVFVDSIEQRLNLEGWAIYENRIVAPNGAKTVYKGANRNPDAMQSAQGFKYSWFEEAHRASKASLDKLLPTIIRNPGAECWFSANPQSSADPFSQRFIIPYQSQLEKDGYYEDDVHLIVVVNWRDNPWWNKEQERLRKWDYENRPRAEYDWIWEGKFYDSVDGAIILPEWFDAAIDAHKKLGFKAKGVRAVGFDPDDSEDGQGDGKAAVYRHGVVVERIDQWGDGDVSDATMRVYEDALDYKATHLTYDAIGVGTGVKVELKHLDPTGKIDVLPFVGSEKPRDPRQKYPDNDKDGRLNDDVFMNLRAQWYWYLKDRFEKTYKAVHKGEYINPDELISIASECEHIPKLRAELCRVPRKRGIANTRIQILSKQEMRTKDIPSPNIADALKMCFANLPPKTKDLQPLKVNTSYVV
jgi:phage terminase large subunit